MSDIHEIYAIKYGRHERKKAENYIGGDPHDTQEPIDFFVWAIVGASGTFVVDTGFDAAMAKKRSRQITKPIAEGLKALDIAPDKITNVIISHLHYDHCGNYDTFPNARFHLQDTEMAYATGRCMCHAVLKTPFEEEDIVAMVRKLYAGRVAFHDGADEIAPGLTVHKIGGHSKGLQCVRVKTRRGHVVIASDTAHLYNHFEQRRIFPTTCNLAEVLEGYDQLRKLATSPVHVIPGHDPEVVQRFPAIPGHPDIVRLDAKPSN